MSVSSRDASKQRYRAQGFFDGPMSICVDCGMCIGDEKVHDQWHAEQDEVMVVVRAIAERTV